MQRFTITKGATSQIIPISIYDSSSTTGAKLAGLVFNSAGLTAYYNRMGAAGAATAITLVTATKGTWTSSGFIAVDGTNMPGDYELHLPDAVLASGADIVAIQLKGAANMVPVNIEIDLKLNVWDEVLNKANYDIAQSAGKRLRQLDDAFEVHSGTAQAGTTTTITLDTGASATDDIYRGDRIIIVAGTGQQEHGICTAYNGTTKVATMAETWVITPDNTSEFEIVPADVDIETWQHVAVTNGATTSLPCVDSASISDSTTAADNVQANIGNLDAAITSLNNLSAAQVNAEADTALADFFTSSAQLVDDIWDEPVTGHTTNNTAGKILKGISEGWISDEGSVNDASATTTSFITDLTNATTSFHSNATLVFITGSLKGQSRVISTYNGTTKAVTFDEAFSAAPADTDQFIVLAQHVHTISDIQTGLATEAKQDTAQTAIDALTDPAGIQKNTAFSNFEFPMVLTSDHYTAATAKTVTGERSIDGGAFAAVTGTIAEVGSGVYQCDLLAADTNGDSITYKFSATDCDDTVITIITRA